MNACSPTRRPLLSWLARGITGVGLVAVAAWAQTPLIAIPAFVAALVAFGGCPMCWTFGLIERASRKSTLEGKDAP
jgi:hypothetical protein